ncbi:MAG: bactofilin family protein [Ilyomonas sp.]
MFNTKSKFSEPVSVEVPSVPGRTSTICSGVTINGEIKTDADIVMDGKMVGNIISSAKVIIGPQGFIEGNITAAETVISGKVQGNLIIEGLLSLKDRAEVRGDITASKIMMEPSITFNGRCTMKSSSTQVVDMMKDKDERKAAAE